MGYPAVWIHNYYNQRSILFFIIFTDQIHYKYYKLSKINRLIIILFKMYILSLKNFTF